MKGLRAGNAFRAWARKAVPAVFEAGDPELLLGGGLGGGWRPEVSKCCLTRYSMNVVGSWMPRLSAEGAFMPLSTWVRMSIAVPGGTEARAFSTGPRLRERPAPPSRLKMNSIMWYTVECILALGIR